MPLIIVGGVRLGVFTATEAGAVALIYAVLCGLFFYRCLIAKNFLEAVREYTSNAVVLLLLINIFLLVVGLFMEMIAAMVILVPILVSILVSIIVAAGVSPVQFAVVLVMNLVIGALTPPMGVLVFTTARVGRANVVDVFRAIVPFVFALIGVLLLVTYVPWLTLAPVRWLGP